MTPMTSTTEIRTDLKDGILVVTMDGPKTRNSIGAPQYLALRAILMDAGNDPGVGAVVLTGANGFFSSGGNVNALKESRTLPLSEVSKNTDALSAMILALRGCPKPVIAAINDPAVGIGATMTPPGWAWRWRWPATWSPRPRRPSSPPPMSRSA